MSGLLQDIRIAIRGLRHKPGFALLAILILALSIGATTIMFTVVSGVVLKPLAYPDSDRLVAVQVQADKSGDVWGFSYPDLPVQQVVKRLDPSLPLYSLVTMNDSLSGANGFMIFRVGALLASAIGGLGLIMAAIGVYGVVAFAVSQRTREIGIRMALGATRRQVLKLALRQGLWAVLAGAGAGLLLAVMISRGIANLLVGVSATDFLTYLGATLFLIAVALLACFIPARRAAKVDPMVALRYE